MRVKSGGYCYNLTRWMAQRRCCVLPFNCNCFVRPSFWKNASSSVDLCSSSFVSFGGWRGDDA